ncbi:MAG TPA: RNA-guided pseudouridylation complex pseudouridine synthase subunit Cbf5 [Nitrososphaeraceae archaeon]|nr:RNA-guided pseudouridylation complex pseudouridine synthase subunit Cbf5 [Nitrososphaeraceae archaeon]
MILPQLENLVKIDDDITSEKYGHYPDKRPISALLDYGLILIDKPDGPTSHEVVAWVKRILNIEKAGHSGTLDPGATGLLPMGLGEGTKAISVLLLGPKEYYALARLHSAVAENKLKSVIAQFTGDIYQRPPQRSSVRRATRVRRIYRFEMVDQYDRLILLQVVCQSGTYIRKIIYDIGEVLGPGATMVELRRTQVSNFNENKHGFVRLHDLADAFEMYKQKNDDDTKLRKLIHPIELCLEGIRGAVIRDTAVDALCHGAQLAVPGIVALPKDLKRNELVGIYTLKGEVVGLAEALMTKEEIEDNIKGVAFSMKRIIMKPGTYPKAWRTSPSQPSSSSSSSSSVSSPLVTRDSNASTSKSTSTTPTTTPKS